MTEEFETIEVRTSCGGVFHERIDDLDNWQITGLIEQNPDHAITPTLKKVLARRQEDRISAVESMLKGFHTKVWGLVPGGQPEGDAIDSWGNFFPQGLPESLQREHDRLMKAWTAATSSTRIVAPTSRAA